MGQNPRNSRPDLPQQPPSGPTGPSASDSGPQSGPGYGYQGPQVAAPGPQDPAASPAYPTPSPTPYGTMPYGTMPYGTMPYGPPPGAGQPGPGPGQPYAGAASQQYAIPGAASTGPTPKKKGKGPLVGLVAGAVVLVLVVGAVATYLLTNRATPAGTEPDTATTSVSALQGYLNALAAGDADKAKLYGVDAPASSPFLTNDFLKAAVTKNPITEIHVTEATDAGSSQYLSASYKLGGDPMQGSYQLTKVAKTWRLKTIITTVDRPSNWGTLGVTVNGTPVSKLVKGLSSKDPAAREAANTAFTKNLQLVSPGQGHAMVVDLLSNQSTNAAIQADVMLHGGLTHSPPKLSKKRATFYTGSVRRRTLWNRSTGPNANARSEGCKRVSSRPLKPVAGTK